MNTKQPSDDAHTSRLRGAAEQTQHSAPKDRLTVTILGTVAAAILIELIAHVLNAETGAYRTISECLSLVALFTLFAPAFYLITRLESARLLKWCIVSAMALGAISQTLNITSHLSWLETWPILPGNSPWHGDARSISMVLGIALLLTSVYLALVETLRAKAKTDASRAILEQEVEERKRTEAIHRESEERYRLVFEGSQEGIVFVGADGKRDVFNQRLASICGYTQEELRELPALSTIHPDDRERMLENNRKRLRGEAFERSYEFRLSHKDGHTIEVEGTFDVVKRDDVVIGVCGIIRDITERKRIEASLREAQERYHALFERSLDALYISDFEGRFVDANPAALALLGYERWEIPNITYAMVLEPDDLPLAFQQLASIGSGEPQQEVTEYRLRRKDGSLVYVETNASLLYRGDTPYGVLGAAHDVTERKLSEDKIRKLADMLDTAPSAITAHDIGGRYVYANKRAFEIHGYADDDFMRLRLQDLVAPESRAYIEPRLKMIAERGEAFFETHHLRKDGTSVPLEVYAKSVNWFGTPAFLSIATDITERKASESALRATESRYRRLFESAKDGILILDAATGSIVDANPYIEELLGYSSREFIGRNLWEIGVFKDTAASKAAFEELRNQDYIRYEDLLLQTKDGAEIAVEFVSNAYLVEGTRVIQCNIRDVSERKQLERQLRQAQKMEAVGQLAGGVAHDFNNLLQVILGNIDFALEGQAPNSPLSATLNEVRKASERAADLTRQLLAFSRQQIMQPVNIDISDVVQGVLRMLRRVIGEHIELCFIPRDNHGIVRVDRGQIEQVLMNLCVNARDAMPCGGRLTIETENVVIDDEYRREHPWAALGPYVVVSVSDTGQGMDAATLSHVFEPFFTTKEVGQGTGLGLATVYGIVKQHHGLVHVYSEPDMGTVFKVYLPIVERAVDSERTDTEAPPVGGVETILVAEDEPMVLSLVVTTLRAAGYTVLSATDGYEALRLFDEHAKRIDLVMLDVMMPGLSGREVMERILIKDPNVEFLFSSGYSQSAIHANFVIKEGLRLIQKPYHGVALQREVRIALDARAERVANRKGPAG